MCARWPFTALAVVSGLKRLRLHSTIEGRFMNEKIKKFEDAFSYCIRDNRFYWSVGINNRYDFSYDQDPKEFLHQCKKACTEEAALAVLKLAELAKGYLDA